MVAAKLAAVEVPTARAPAAASANQVSEWDLLVFMMFSLKKVSVPSQIVYAAAYAGCGRHFHLGPPLRGIAVEP